MTLFQNRGKNCPKACKSVAILSGPLHHHLDHLAPLAALLEIPLLVDDQKVYEIGKADYPDLEIVLETIDLQKIGEQFTTVILSTQGAAQELRPLFTLLGFPKIEFCYCPHGHSDKGSFDREIIRVIDQDLLLLYGPLQYERLNKIGPLPRHLFVGNYRAYYFEKHGSKGLSLFNKKQKTALYAPTWADTEKGSSFLSHYEELIRELPDDINLVIKLHPFLEKYHPAHVYRALGLGEDKPNLLILPSSKPIYPLLQGVDLYLGDYSAIGYDFLYFNRPMFFFAPLETTLHSCGRHMKTPQEFYDQIDDLQEELTQQRTALYERAFTSYTPQLLRGPLH